MGNDLAEFRARARLELVEALLRALDRIDEIHAIVRASEDNDAAYSAIGELGFSEFEVHHILDLPIRRQTHQARTDLEEERAALVRSLGELDQ